MNEQEKETVAYATFGTLGGVAIMAVAFVIMIVLGISCMACLGVAAFLIPWPNAHCPVCGAAQHVSGLSRMTPLQKMLTTVRCATCGQINHAGAFDH